MRKSSWALEYDMDCIREAFKLNPHKSNYATNSQLKTPHSTVHNVLHKHLHLRAYKIQLLQALKLNDQVDCTNFTVDMLDRHDFLNKLCFSDEATFHVSRIVNVYKCRILGNRNPHVTCQLETDSAKMNVWCCLMHDTVIRTYFFSELTMTRASYLKMLELYALPQLPPPNKMGHSLPIATPLRITQCFADRLAEECQSPGLLGHQT